MKVFLKVFIVWLIFTSVKLGQCAFGGANSRTMPWSLTTAQSTGSLTNRSFFITKVTPSAAYPLSIISIETRGTLLTAYDSGSYFMVNDHNFGGNLQPQIPFKTPINGHIRKLPNQLNCQHKNGSTTTPVRYNRSASIITAADSVAGEVDGTLPFKATYTVGALFFSFLYT